MTGPTKFIIVPVGTPGCGKNILGKALAELYPDWLHLDKSLIKGMSGDAKTNFETMFVDYLTGKCGDKETNIVYLDRNHQTRWHRNGVTSNLQSKYNNAQNSTAEPSEFVYICLNFGLPQIQSSADNSGADDGKWSQIKTTNQERLLSRPDFQLDNNGSNKERERMVQIISHFNMTFQRVNCTRSPDSRFDLVVDLDCTQEDHIFEYLKKIIEVLGQKYGKELIPRNVSEEEMRNVADKVTSEDSN